MPDSNRKRLKKKGAKGSQGVKMEQKGDVDAEPGAVHPELVVPDLEPEAPEHEQDGVPVEPSSASAVQNIGTTSLDALQSTESRKVMDIVDRLRRSGLSGELQLPQLVVSGDQSSGKSSVLEAITEIPFPRKENLCTRFATEIILRRAATASISTKIIPDKVCPATEKKRLEAFKSKILDFSELPTLMEEATNLMGLGDDGSGQARAFSRDVLSIEIAGPNRPHLTLVDLPGLIHSENKMQSKEDVELIPSLVDDYIKEKRTIIMAVVSAKNDYANQIILKKCRDVDPMGHRTLGIVTKPDFLEPGSENETSWFELANNHDIFFHLGWHMLKNRSGKEMNDSFEARNKSEATFFAKGRYRDLPPEMLGISTLRSRLSQLLYKYLKTELPALQKELDEKHREVCRALEQLGEKRSTPHEQRRFLMNVSTTYQDIVKTAVIGQYEHDFFGDLDTDEALDHDSNMRRLRAVVHHFNTQFATATRLYGHKFRISDADDGATEFGVDRKSETELDELYARFSDFQSTTTREDAISRVRRILVRSRGRELPGTFNPMLTSQLFWEQSENWKMIAEFHIDKVSEACTNFVAAAIDHSVSSDVSTRLQQMTIDDALQKRLFDAKAELGRIIADSKHHLITYDPAYIDVVWKVRADKHGANLDKLMGQAKVNVTDAYNQTSQYLNPDVLQNGINGLMDRDMDKKSAEDALDCQLAYYKEEVNYFIAAVTKQVVERYLMRDLAADTISPVSIGDMSDDEIAFIAAEPEETTREREHLEGRKATLEKGQQTFRSALGLSK